MTTQTSAVAANRGTQGRADVQEFFDRMARALTTGDGKTISFMWGYPGFVFGDADARVVATREEVAAFFGGAKEHYNTRGIADTRAEIRGLEWVTDKVAVVDVRWPYVDAQGAEVGEECSTYTLRRDDDGELRLYIALMRGEGLAR